MHNQDYDVTVDYFAVLGVHYGACPKTVKQAFRKMARRYHPDVSKIHNATEKFQEISAAYEVLTKFRERYCVHYERVSQKSYQTKSQPETARGQSASGVKTDRQKEKAQYQSNVRRTQKPINGKDRRITYPLTLRYAIRLLKIGYFYIPGLKVKMRFTREAFTGKTFRLKGKGYLGLFGGEPGDYLVSFSVKLETLKWTLKGADLYGMISVPNSLIKPYKVLDLDSPTGALSVTIPQNYQSDTEIKIPCMGLPADMTATAGDCYIRLIAT